LLVMLQQQQRRRILQGFDTCVLDTLASGVFKSYITEVLYEVLNIAKSIFVNFASWVDSIE